MAPVHHARRRGANLALLVVSAVVAALAAPAASHATYPGKNGPIVFQMNGDIWAINGNGKGLRRVTNFKGKESDAVVSPDGRRVAFRAKPFAGEGSQIIVSDMRGRKPRWITRNFVKGITWLSFFWPMWSRDGKRLTFGCNHIDEEFEFCSTDVAGKRLRLLTRCDCVPPAESNQADLARSGLAALAGGDAFDKLFVFRFGARPTPIFSRDDSRGGSSMIQEPSWSPNDREIAFQEGDTNSAIMLIGANGANPRRILLPPEGDFSNYTSPSWSPDGKRLVIHVTGLGPGSGGKPKGLYTVDPRNPQDLRPIFIDQLNRMDQYADPSWGPAPRRR